MRDFIDIIENMAQSERGPYFDRVWSAYEKVRDRSQPDAVALLDPKTIEHVRRRHHISSNQRQRARLKTDTDTDNSVFDGGQD
jgi:hypothetical protein